MTTLLVAGGEPLLCDLFAADVAEVGLRQGASATTAWSSWAYRVSTAIAALSSSAPGKAIVDAAASSPGPTVSCFVLDGTWSEKITERCDQRRGPK